MSWHRDSPGDAPSPDPASAAEDHFYRQSLMEPGPQSCPDCHEVLQPDEVSGHQEVCTEELTRLHGALAPIRFVLAFTIAGKNYTRESRGTYADAADAALAQFAAVMKESIANARRIVSIAPSRQERADAVNNLLIEIGDRGRNFFRHGTRRADFYIDDNRRLNYIDEISGRRVPIAETTLPGNFSHGGGLWSFVKELRDFIQAGEKIDADFGAHWGYPPAELSDLRAIACDLGIAETKDEVPF